jgi:hypothetical protein
MIKKERDAARKLAKLYREDLWLCAMAYCRDAPGKHDDLFVEGRIPYHNSHEYYETWVKGCIPLLSDFATSYLLFEKIKKEEIVSCSLSFNKDYNKYTLEIHYVDDTFGTFSDESLGLVIANGLLSIKSKNIL